MSPLNFLPAKLKSERERRGRNIFPPFSPSKGRRILRKEGNTITPIRRFLDGVREGRKGRQKGEERASALLHLNFFPLFRVKRMRRGRREK